jgi:integrase
MCPQRAHKGAHEAEHLALKRGVYQYRRRLPESLGGGEVSISLGTGRFTTAAGLARDLDAAFAAAIERAAVAPMADIRGIVRTYLQDALEADREYRLTAKPRHALYSLAHDPDDPQNSATDADLEVINGILSETEDAYGARDVRRVGAKLDHLMEAHSIPAEARRELGLALLEADLEIYREMRARLLGKPYVLGSAGATAPSPAAPSTPPVPSGPLLSTFVDPFLEAARKDKAWRGQTEAQARATFRLFQEVSGDKPPAAYTRKDTGLFYDTLRKLPALYAKDKRWRSMTVAEIVVASAALPDAERLTLKTVKRHFSALSPLFEHLKQRGHYTEENPARGFDFPSKGRRREERDMWQGDELRTLFASPVWTGSHHHFRSKPGAHVIRDARYWLPLLGLYHGNRLEEFAQLRRSDLGQDGGIWFLRITDEGEGLQLKNEQSRRDVPLHPAIIALGFLDYAKGLTGERMFPDLQPGGPDNKLGYYFTKWFSAYRGSIGLRRKGLDYHSFRHGVTTKLYASGVGDAVVDLLTGHDAASESRGRYLKALPLGVLAEAIGKVEWPEVSLAKP